MFPFGIGFKRYKPKKYRKNKKILEYPCIQKDETAIKVGFWINMALDCY